MSERDESVEDRMKRLARATEPLAPRPGFEHRVMQAIQAEAKAARAPGWLTEVLSASRRAFIPAVLAAAAGVALAAVGERSANESLAASYTDVDDVDEVDDVGDVGMESDW